MPSTPRRHFASVVAGEDPGQFNELLGRLLTLAASAGFERGDGEPYAIPDMAVSPTWTWDFRSVLSSPGHMAEQVEFLLWISEPAGMRGYNIDLDACGFPGVGRPAVFTANRYDFGWAVRAGDGEFCEVSDDDDVVRLFEQYLTDLTA